MTPSGSSEPIVIKQEGRVGLITLNRPDALNALTLAMIQTIDVALETWRDDPTVHLIVVHSSGGRAFCAGGDVRSIRDWALAEQFQTIDEFFVSEYALNRTIARYNKPYVALVDGICMGGGIGLSVHGSVRVATESAVFAMPEAQLGLFPDVGASYFLPRLRGGLGTYVGMTGARIGAADACWLGLATHFAPRAALPALLDGLIRNGISALAEFTLPPQTPGLEPIEAKVSSIFSDDSVAAIMRRLENVEQAWASDALAAMRSASPNALAWTLELLRAGAHRTFEECQRAEILLTRRACRYPDFTEGVRAAVIDKDRKPQWRPLETA